MLNVDRGVDIDAARQQLLDVEIAFRMAAAGRVGMGEFIDQRELRTTRDQGVEVHLLDRLIPIHDAFAWDDFKPVQQRFGFRPSVGLDDADDHIDAGLAPCMSALQHLVGLADAGRGADEDLQTPSIAGLAPRGLQQGFWRGTLFGVAALLLSHKGNIVLAPRRA